MAPVRVIRTADEVSVQIPFRDVGKIAARGTLQIGSTGLLS